MSLCHFIFDVIDNERGIFNLQNNELGVFVFISPGAGPSEKDIDDGNLVFFLHEQNEWVRLIEKLC